MKTALRMRLSPALVVAGIALLVPAMLFAAPRVAGPAMGRRPVAPPTFDVGPDAMGNYEVDPTSTVNEVVFTSKAPKETIKGKSTKATGHLEFNPRKLDSVVGKFSVQWKDVDTGNPMRNQHMMSKEQGWIDGKAYPEIVFSVTEFELPKVPVKPGKSGSHAIKGKLVGKFEMNGKEKAMKIPATLAYVESGKSESGEPIKEGVGVKAKFAVNLADFDIAGKGVGEKVAKKQQISVSLFLAKSDGSTPIKEDDGKKTSKKKDKKHKKDDESKES